MVPSTLRDARSYAVPAAGFVVVVFVTTNMAFMIKDAQITDLALSSFQGSAAGAAALNATSLVGILILTYTRTRNIQPRRICQTIPGWIGALFSLASTIITINVLVLKKINPTLVERANRSLHISTDVELAIWALSTVAQLVFYAVFAFIPPIQQSNKNLEMADASPLATLEKKRSPPSRPIIISTSSHARQQSPPRLEVGQADNRRSSWRNSFTSIQQFVRQPTVDSPQQRRGLLQQSLDSTNNTARSSISRDDVQLATALRADTFDSFSWDFFAPATQTRDTITQSAPTRKGGLLPINGTMLPTIPGSRPTSSGEPLGEPFEMVRPGIVSYTSEKSKDSFDIHRPVSDASVDKFSLERVRDLSERPISVLSTASTITLPDNLPRRPDTSLSLDTLTESRPSTMVSMTPTSPTVASLASRPTTAYSSHSTTRRPALASRPTTPSVHEAHIHPLFRADSPVPPPAVSANTVITASTFSGQTIGQVGPTPPPAQPRTHLPFTPETPPPAIPRRSQSRSQSRQRAGAASPPPTGASASYVKRDSPQKRSETPVQQSRHSSAQSSPQGTPKRGKPILGFMLPSRDERGE